MATPTVSASLDKSTYPVGALMTLTVTYGDSDRQTLSVTISVKDADGNASAPVTIPVVIDPLTLTVASIPARVWTKVSDNGAVAVFTANA